MAQPDRGFETAEFEQRTVKAQALMADADLAGLLLMSEPEVRYFSGFQTLFWQSPTRPWFLFLPDQGKPIAIIPKIGEDLMRRTWLDDIRTWNAPAPDDDGLSLLCEVLGPYAARQEKIGILKGHETHLRMPLGDFERLKAGLPGLHMADATPLLRRLRMIKSKAEIEKISCICEIGSRSFERVPEIASPGQPLDALFRAFRREALAQGADDIPYLVGGAHQGGYADVISPPSLEPLRSKDIVMLDTGAVWDGYFCDFDRNFAIGAADALSLQAYDVLWDATEAALDMAKPGVTCQELYHRMHSVISQFAPQDADVGRLGHGLGMQLTEWPSIAAWDETVLQENMVLTIEPSLGYANGRMMVHEENIVIRPNGAELLTQRAPNKLPIIKG